MCPGDATGVTEGPHGPEQPHLGSPGALFKLISGPCFSFGLCRRGAALQLSLALGTLRLTLTCCLPGTVLTMPHHSGPADGLPGSPWDLSRCGDALCSWLALAATSGFGHPPICLPGDGGEGRDGAGLFTFVLQVVLKRARSPWGSGSAMYSLSWVPGLEPVITQCCTLLWWGSDTGCFPWCWGAPRSGSHVLLQPCSPPRQCLATAGQEGIMPSCRVSHRAVRGGEGEGGSSCEEEAVTGQC